MSSKRYRQYWDQEGAQKNFSTPFQMDVFRNYVQPQKRILDVGCGYGRIMAALKDAGYKNIVGAEPSSSLKERAGRSRPDLDIRSYDGITLPFEDNSFDAVVLAGVLTSIPLDEDQDRIMSEIRRVLVKGGILYVNDFLLNTDDRNLERYEMYKDKYGTYGIFELYDGGVTRHHTRERVGELLKGYKYLAFEDIVYTTMNGNRSNGFYFLGRLS